MPEDELEPEGLEDESDSDVAPDEEDVPDQADAEDEDDDVDTESPNWLVAVRAAQDKKATDIKVLDLREITSFTDFFVLCNGSNPKQIQAITDEIQQKLKARGEYAGGIEGYETGEWILSDYLDLIIHVFNEKTRQFYDLDRLWREAREVAIPAE